MKVYTLKNKKTLTAPSLFINPQNHIDAKALLLTDNNYGLPNIDGILISIMDYTTIYNNLGFSERQLFPSTRSTIRDKIRLIDPSLHFLLIGNNEQKRRMLETKLFDKRIGRVIHDVINDGMSNTEKTQKMINEAYPYLYVRPFIEFQIKNNTDIVIAPSINISSSKYFLQQINKARNMLMDSKILFETSFKGYAETHDFMNVITLNTKVINERNFHDLFELSLCNEPDHIGIRILGISESDTITTELIFKFLREFYIYIRSKIEHKHIPLHLINVDELGYVGYCNGICNIVSPIATSPYYAYPSKKLRESYEEIDNSGTYYHPLNMNQPKISMLDNLPCACAECRKYINVNNIRKDRRPLFRRIHWLLSKDEEIRQFRETPARLDIALRDKFANSMRTQLVAYIPMNPIFAV